MTSYTLTHLTDSSLLRELKSLVTQDRATTALLIAHLGETDARRLYAPAGYPSMYEYCIHELRFSEPDGLQADPGGSDGPPVPVHLRHAGRRPAEPERRGHAHGAT